MITLFQRLAEQVKGLPARIKPVLNLFLYFGKLDGLQLISTPEEQTEASEIKRVTDDYGLRRLSEDSSIKKQNHAIDFIARPTDRRFSMDDRNLFAESQPSPPCTLNSDIHAETQSTGSKRSPLCTLNSDIHVEAQSTGSQPSPPCTLNSDIHAETQATGSKLSLPCTLNSDKQRPVDSIKEQVINRDKEFTVIQIKPTDEKSTKTVSHSSHLTYKPTRQPSISVHKATKPTTRDQPQTQEAKKITTDPLFSPSENTENFFIQLVAKELYEPMTPQVSGAMPSNKEINQIASIHSVFNMFEMEKLALVTSSQSLISPSAEKELSRKNSIQPVTKEFLRSYHTSKSNPFKQQRLAHQQNPSSPTVKITIDRIKVLMKTRKNDTENKKTKQHSNYAVKSISLVDYLTKSGSP